MYLLLPFQIILLYKWLSKTCYDVLMCHYVPRSPNVIVAHGTSYIIDMFIDQLVSNCGFIQNGRSWPPTWKGPG